MKKKWISLLSVISLSFLLAGCGEVYLPETVTESSIYVSPEGAITYCLVESFEADYYDVDELSDMAKVETSEDNNGKGSEKVKIDEINAFDGKVLIKYEFSDVDSFNDFTGLSLTYTTVGDYLTSQVVSENMIDPKKGNAMDGKMFDKLSAKHIIVSETDAALYYGGKLLYMSDNGGVGDDGGVRPYEEGEKITLIINK